MFQGPHDEQTTQEINAERSVARIEREVDEIERRLVELRFLVAQLARIVNGEAVA